MPNLCANRMRVSAPARHLNDFAADCMPAGELDFDKIMPMPAVLDGASEGVSNWMGSDAQIGIEVLTRQPWKRPYREQAESVLDREPVRKAGISSYDDLEAWVRRERPQALEMGRKCLQAFQETGYWFAGDWRVAKWGTGYIWGFELVERTETTIVATFATPWSPPDGICREMARRHPQVDMRIATVEEGNEISYLFTASGGVVREEEPDLTTAFLEEVHGAPIEVHPTYLRPAKLRRGRLTHFRHWPDQRRLKRALEGYPVYAPPHAGIEMLMPERQARENFEYFMSGRETRIGHLRDFLAPFGVDLAFSDSAKQGLDAWISRYGGFLYVDETGASFLTRNPAWHGPRAGLNVIFDLATFLGEFAIRESGTLHWELYTDVPEGLRSRDESYQKPVIAGVPDNPRWRFYIMDDVHDCCRALRETSYLRQKSRFVRPPTVLHAQFASRTLRRMYCTARGDQAGANKAAGGT